MHSIGYIWFRKCDDNNDAKPRGELLNGSEFTLVVLCPQQWFLLNIRSNSLCLFPQKLDRVVQPQAAKQKQIRDSQKSCITSEWIAWVLDVFKYASLQQSKVFTQFTCSAGRPCVELIADINRSQLMMIMMMIASTWKNNQAIAVDLLE